MFNKTLDECHAELRHYAKDYKVVDTLCLGLLELQLREAIDTERSRYEEKRNAFNRFFAAVVKMRHAQIAYFRERTSDWLNKSKALEREVDEMAHAIQTGSAFVTQQELNI